MADTDVEMDRGEINKKINNKMVSHGPLFLLLVVSVLESPSDQIELTKDDDNELISLETSKF